jgi:GNAT superfamily N-acetyltransferase
MKDPVVRTMRETDLPEVDRIFRLAFGTFVGLPDPMSFAGDSDWTAGRWRADPSAAFVAELEGDVVGSNFATRWGSVGIFGPLTVRPDLWDRGIARRLLDPVMERFAAWGTTHDGLFTFAQSAKHVALYGKYGFHPRFLTAIMEKPLAATPSGGWTAYSSLAKDAREAALADCRGVAASLYEGLDLGREIAVVADDGLGDTVLVRHADRLLGFAVCHVGPRTEAGSDVAYVKFGAVRAGADERDFDVLLDACEAFAASRGVRRVAAGTNLARERAYRRMLARGFRTAMQGVALHRPNEPGYSRPDVFALDDWR